MCVVSMIHEHFQTPWQPFSPRPGTVPLPSPDFTPPQPSVPPGWTWIKWGEYQELLRKAAEYDKRMGQPECEDPQKEAMMAEIEKRLTEKFGLRPA